MKIDSAKIPRNLFLLWDKKRAEWPPIVEFCIGLWEEINPDWNITVFDGEDVESHLGNDFSRDVIASLPIQAKSDIFRSLLLSKTGGIWADATTFPHMPLTSWIGEFDGNDFSAPPNLAPGRPVCSWFMISSKDGVIMSRQYELLKLYWTEKKIMLPGNKEAHGIIEKNWENYVSDFASKKLQISPYFFFHYLFAREIGSNSEFREVFNRQKLMYLGGYGKVDRHLLSPNDEGNSFSDVVRFLQTTDIQLSKLSWKKPYKTPLPLSDIRGVVLQRALKNL